MSWFRRKRIDPPSTERSAIDVSRSERAVKESQAKLEQAKKQRDEVIKVTKKSRELDRNSDYFAEALERAMRRQE